MAKLSRAALIVLSAGALVLSAPIPAVAKSNSGTDSRPVSSRIFASSSPFYQKLPNSTPAASDSNALVSSLKKQAHKYYGTATTPNVAVNTGKFSTPLYVARNSDPVYDITAWNCQSHTASVAVYLNAQLKNIHIPNDMQPDPSSDGSVAIYNPDSKELVELWKARKSGGKWQACWGGKIANADKSSGVFSGTFGSSASGMSLWGTIIREQELLNGRIDHVVSLAIPQTKKGSVSWPAVRTDGWWSGSELSIGQMLRLPASLNIDAMKLSPTARVIAKAAQEYGIIITDTSGSVSFAAENPIALRENRYPSIFRGRDAWAEMAGDQKKGEVAFPLEKLVALPMNYKAPINGSVNTPPPATTPPVTSNPPSSPTIAGRYSGAVINAKPWLYWTLSDKGSTAADSSGNGRNGALNSVWTGAVGAVGGNAAITTQGKQGSLVSTTVASRPAASFSVQLWFKTSSKSGGKLAGFESAKIGNGEHYDRSIYLTNEGKLVFGTYSGKVSTLTSSRTYNDGAWHMVTATQSSAGSKLYVDGALVASNGTTKAEAGAGYWRVGGGNMKDWPTAPSSYYVQASLDEFAVYESALSASTVTAQYKAAF
ncbi:LamG domain-containing protein [Micropruina sp.]|uniref:LamG domain-containing protein n=1 Tax=Micropruina sp. TaxID=2737536 RepID=UPI0039E3CE80